MIPSVLNEAQGLLERGHVPLWVEYRTKAAKYAGK